MCGICGIWNYRRSGEVDRWSMERMESVLRHRGPDDNGVYFDANNPFSLGFRRLAIIDLSAAGHQPMSNEDGTVWLAFNGEIYNYRRLAPHLQAKGHAFRSQTDSEVIIHQYEERGFSALNDLNGMFAIALWDANKKRLLVACDRVGKKPIYYYDNGSTFIFASELKALLVHEFVPREINYDALGSYLAVGYVPAPNTIFKNVYKLEPAHAMTVTPEGRDKWRYWDWRPAFRSDIHRSENEWLEEIRAVLTESVRDRLMSDVPLGAFLSGGVDSSAVVATMAGLVDRPVKTFSIGFANEDYDELDYARQVARRFGTDHHEMIVEPEDLSVLAPRLVRIFDEPFADPSAVPTYYVSKMAREHVTVCLSGDGGDEALGGYGRYALMMRLLQSERLPYGLRRALFWIPANVTRPGIKGHRFFQRMLLTENQRYADAMRFIPRPLLSSLLGSEATLELTQNGTGHIATLLKQNNDLDYLSRLQYADSLSYLPGDILVKVDRTSMANSLEVRSPLLDYRFLELVAGIPPELRLRNGEGKYLFKKAMRGILPDPVLDRSKMGFGIPLREWFRGELVTFAKEVLLDRRTLQRGLWDEKALAEMLERHRVGHYHFEAPIWVLLVLELWWRAYLD